MRRFILSSGCLLFSLAACGVGDDRPDHTPSNGGDPGGQDPNPTPMNPNSMDPNPMNPMPMEPMHMDPAPGGAVIQTSNVSGEWSGTVELKGRATIAAGERLIIRAGTVVRAETTGALQVDGTLELEGTAADLIKFESSGWTGITVSATGHLVGGGARIDNGSACLDGLPGSTIDITEMTFAGCSRGVHFGNGGKVTKTRILAGATVSITGGLLEMSDSSIEFTGPQASDCTHFGGGTAHLDHVRFTACHCPIHVARTDAPFIVTNSIFDVASYSVMISNSEATFTGNHFESSSAEFLDIGGGINANIAGNYWGGGAPNVSSNDLAQFTGMQDFVTTPMPGVGPR